MFGVIPTNPDLPGAGMAVLYLHNDGNVTIVIPVNQSLDSLYIDICISLQGRSEDFKVKQVYYGLLVEVIDR